MQDGPAPGAQAERAGGDCGHAHACRWREPEGIGVALLPDQPVAAGGRGQVGDSVLPGQGGHGQGLLVILAAEKRDRLPGFQELLCGELRVRVRRHDRDLQRPLQYAAGLIDFLECPLPALSKGGGVRRLDGHFAQDDSGGSRGRFSPSWRHERQGEQAEGGQAAEQAGDRHASSVVAASCVPPRKLGPKCRPVCAIGGRKQKPPASVDGGGSGKAGLNYFSLVSL